MAVMNDYVLLNAAIDAGGLATPAFLLGQNNNAVSATLTVVAGTTPTGSTLTVQQSNDGVTWKTFSTSTSFDGKTGPDVITESFGATSTVLTMKYVRFLFLGPTNGFVIVNFLFSPYRAA